MTVTLETQALAQEWAEDPEAMSEERREALLEYVRERIEALRPDRPDPVDISYYIAIDVDCFGLHLFDERTAELAMALCEEAGLPS